MKDGSNKWIWQDSKSKSWWSDSRWLARKHRGSWHQELRQRSGPTWPQSSPVRQWQKAHRKTPSNCETSFAKIQGTTFSFGLDGHASCIKLLDWKTSAKGLDSGIWKQFPLPSCRVAVGPIFWARRNETGPRNCGLLNHPKTTGSSSLQAGNLLRGVGAKCGSLFPRNSDPQNQLLGGWGQKSWSSYGDFGGVGLPDPKPPFEIFGHVGFVALFGCPGEFEMIES